MKKVRAWFSPNSITNSGHRRGPQLFLIQVLLRILHCPSLPPTNAPQFVLPSCQATRYSQCAGWVVPQWWNGLSFERPHHSYDFFLPGTRHSSGHGTGPHSSLWLPSFLSLFFYGQATLIGLIPFPPKTTSLKLLLACHQRPQKCQIQWTHCSEFILLQYVWKFFTERFLKPKESLRERGVVTQSPSHRHEIIWSLVLS